jgi:hypothetical protein
MDPLIYTNELITGLLSNELWWQYTIYSVSTKLATFPSSFSPLFRYRVPAKYLDLLEININDICLVSFCKSTRHYYKNRMITNHIYITMHNWINPFFMCDNRVEILH